MDTTDIERAVESTGGAAGGRTYTRYGEGDPRGGQFAPKGTSGSGRSPLSDSRPYQIKQKAGGGGSAPTAPRASSKFKTLGLDEDNDPAAVADMQRLLTALGLGNLSSGVYDKDTEAAVMEAQRRLGVKKPNGKATKALVNKMLNAYDLSPCVQRSEDLDPDEVERGHPYPGQKYRHGWIPAAPAALLPADVVDDEYGAEIDSVDVGEECRIVAREHGVTVESDQGDDIAIHTAPSQHEAERWADAIDDRETYTRPSFATQPYEGGMTVRFGDVELDLDDEDASVAAQALRDMAYQVEDRGTVPDEADMAEPEGDETPIPDDDERRSRPPCEFTVTRSEDETVFDRLRASVMDDDEVVEVLDRADMSTRDINDLPDDEFGYIEPGGEKDDQDRTVPRSLRHFPLHDEAHVRNALARMSQSPHGRHAAKRIHAAAKRYGVGAQRSELWTPDQDIMRSYTRTWGLDDIEIMRGGDGRTVEAYAAVFDTPTEIRDQHGHYMEVINRSAFNRAISHGIDRVGFYYHHGMTLHGTPSDLGSVPIGEPIDVRADGKGLRTVSRFNKTPLAESVLEAIHAGNIKGYSFRGRIYQSTPNKVPPRPRAAAGDLPTVTRTELGLTEYGPTPTPYYAGAGIVAVRSAQQLATELAGLDRERRAELVRIISATTPPGDPEADHYATPTEGPGAADPHPDVHSGRQLSDIARKIQRARILQERIHEHQETG